MIIADTCLIFHLFNETVLTDSAVKVLDKDSHWIVPSLWRAEYANILSKLTRKGKQTPDEVIDHFKNTVEKFKDSEMPVDLEQALAISIAHKISVYDAYFISLAINFNTLLVTEDQEVIKKCSSLAISIADFLKEKREMKPVFSR